MEFMTLKQYAESKNVSYEAVRRQVIKYKQELADHIVKKDGVQYLDGDAIDFLSERRRRSPLVVVQETNTDKIAALEAEIDSLKTKLLTAQDEILQAQRRLIEAQDAQTRIAEDKIRYELLLEDRQREREELKQTREELSLTRERLRDAERDAGQAREQLKDAERETDKVRGQLQDAEREAGSYKRTWFGLYRKS